MATNIIREIRDYNRWVPRELIQEYTVRSSSKGEGKRYNAITEMAQQLAGLPSSDKRSKEYKASRRNVERYLQGTRKPGKATQEKMSELGQQFKKPRPAKFELDGKIYVGTSPDKARDRTIQLAKWISQDQWDYLSELADEGNEGAIWEDLATYYQVDHLEMVSGEISIR